MPTRLRKASGPSPGRCGHTSLSDNSGGTTHFDWLDFPAAGKLSVSTPRTLEPFDHYNASRRYADQVKPHNFGLTFYPKEDGIPKSGRVKEPFHLIAPFETDARRWLSLNCFNLYTGERYRIRTGDSSFAVGNVTVVKSYRDVLKDYLDRPELKLAGPDGLACGRQTIGLLHRRDILVTGVTGIGRETNDLEDREAGLPGELDEDITDFGDPRQSVARWSGPCFATKIEKP